MRQLWLHIGTSKTGSTSVQRYARDRKAYLLSHGIDFLVRRRRTAYNDMAIYLRGGDMATAAKVGGQVRGLMAKSDAQVFVMSSEMLHPGTAGALREALALTEPVDVKIICYFRRQDRYLESSYKQKMKTGKVAPGFQNHLNKFGTGAGDYLALVDNWLAAWPEAEFIFRRFEPARFPHGNVVHDLMSVFGLDIAADGMEPMEEMSNPTPTIDILDLMQIVSRVPGLDARRIVRSLPLGEIPRFRGRAMDHDQARALLDTFAEGNEVLRQRFFPEDEVLFDTSDLSGDPPEIATPTFTDDQRALIEVLLKTVVKVNAKGR